MKVLNKIAAITATFALAGCLETAGTLTNQDTFAAATEQNTLIQTGQGGSAAYLQHLSARFRAEVPTMINFDFNSTVLDGEAQRVLRLQAEWIIATPTVKFRVYGHTDKVGGNSFNQRLGLRRARVAVNYLVAQGVPRNRLEAYTSLGETQPLVNTEDRERLNRRTITDVVGFAPGVSGTDFDGKRATVIYGNYYNNDPIVMPGSIEVPG
ncbi:MAG: OmpA family protein [Rhodobacteraceae bacterium]|nr:OmpA family protein [Paracoccaceae bacterium]